jgi:hypothetical protein
MGDLVAARRRRAHWVMADGATTVDYFGTDVNLVAGGCRDRDCSRHGCKLRWNKVARATETYCGFKLGWK